MPRRDRKYVCFFFYYYLLGAKVTAIFVYVVVPNNADVTEVGPRYTFEVDSRNWPKSSDCISQDICRKFLTSSNQTSRDILMPVH